MTNLTVRERAPLRLHVTIDTPSGRSFRWGRDETDAQNAVGDLTFSSTAPGGFEQASASLARRIVHDFPDLEELSTVTIRGAGGEVAGEYRLEGSPRQWGQQSGVQPQLNGWQNHLQDDNSAREIYLDCEQTRFQGASVQRKLNLLGSSIDTDDPSNTPDATTGEPALATQFAGGWGREHDCEAWYDANGIDLGHLYYAWKVGAITSTDTNWFWQAFLSTNDVVGAADLSGNLRGAGPGTGVVNASGAGKKFAAAQLVYLAADPSSTDGGITYTVYWTYLGVVGRHGLPIQGTLTATGGIGLLASDVIAHAVGAWAPKLAFTTGADGTIQPTSFVIPQLAFPDPTTVSAIIQQAASFELLDWFVWENKTFWLNEQGDYPRARHWRARTGPAQLQDTGPQISQIYNGVIVQFTDGGGVTRSVGPPGSGCNVEDASLADADPLNPANEAGIRRYPPPLQMGIGEAGGAINVGVRFLQEQKQINTSGNATLTGHVEDDRGVLWPYWKVRGGDTVEFVDAADTSPRRIVRAEPNDASKSVGVSLDAPPDGMQQLLARLGVKFAAAGIS